MASIPIAIEIVCTSTLAVGSRRLAESKVIVARLSAIEELAGMTILCSDKTGACGTRTLHVEWCCTAGTAGGARIACALFSREALDISTHAGRHECAYRLHYTTPSCAHVS